MTSVSATPTSRTPPRTVFALDDGIRRWGRAVVRARVRAGRWRLVLGRVLVIHNGVLSWHERVWLAVLAAPEGGYGRRHGQLLGGFGEQTPRSDVHVILPVGSRPQPSPGVQWGWSSQLGPDDVDTSAWPPRTFMARSVLDMAADASDARTARAHVARAVQQKAVRLPALRAALARRTRTKYAAAIKDSIP